MTSKQKPRKRRPLTEEIAETEKLDQHESVRLIISLLRSLYLHILIAMRDGPYVNPSSYIADLIRRDKRVNPPLLNKDPVLSAEDKEQIKRNAHTLLSRSLTEADWK